MPTGTTNVPSRRNQLIDLQSNLIDWFLLYVNIGHYLVT